MNYNIIVILFILMAKSVHVRSCCMQSIYVGNVHVYTSTFTSALFKKFISKKSQRNYQSDLISTTLLISETYITWTVCYDLLAGMSARFVVPASGKTFWLWVRQSWKKSILARTCKSYIRHVLPTSQNMLNWGDPLCNRYRTNHVIPLHVK